MKMRKSSLTISETFCFLPHPSRCSLLKVFESEISKQPLPAPLLSEYGQFKEISVSEIMTPKYKLIKQKEVKA